MFTSSGRLLISRFSHLPLYSNCMLSLVIDSRKGSAMTSSQEIDSRFTPLIVGQLTEAWAVDATEVGALSKWNSIVAILFQHWLVTKRRVNIDELACHPKNRSESGVNSFDAHRLIAHCKAVGADKDHLAKSTAWEMFPCGPDLDEQLQFNQRLVSQSQGSLAPLNGTEKLLTIASSHMAAGCRAVKAGCKSHEKSLCDSDSSGASTGVINTEKVLRGSPSLAELVNSGWEFLIIPWYLARLFPEMPEFAQRALNSEHGAAAAQSELQVMSSMALYVQSMDQSNINWKEVADHAAATRPACYEYLDTLCDFIMYYGGGEGAPIVRYKHCNIAFAFSICFCVLKNQNI